MGKKKHAKNKLPNSLKQYGSPQQHIDHLCLEVERQTNYKDKAKIATQLLKQVNEYVKNNEQIDLFQFRLSDDGQYLIDVLSATIPFLDTNKHFDDLFEITTHLSLINSDKDLLHRALMHYLDLELAKEQPSLKFILSISTNISYQCCNRLFIDDNHLQKVWHKLLYLALYHNDTPNNNIAADFLNDLDELGKHNGKDYRAFATNFLMQNYKSFSNELIQNISQYLSNISHLFDFSHFARNIDNMPEGQAADLVQKLWQGREAQWWQDLGQCQSIHDIVKILTTTYENKRNRTKFFIEQSGILFTMKDYKMRRALVEFSAISGFNAMASLRRLIPVIYPENARSNLSIAEELDLEFLLFLLAEYTPENTIFDPKNLDFFALDAHFIGKLLAEERINDLYEVCILYLLEYLKTIAAQNTLSPHNYFLNFICLSLITDKTEFTLGLVYEILEDKNLEDNAKQRLLEILLENEIFGNIAHLLQDRSLATLEEKARKWCELRFKAEDKISQAKLSIAQKDSLKVSTASPQTQIITLKKQLTYELIQDKPLWQDVINSLDKMQDCLHKLQESHLSGEITDKEYLPYYYVVIAADDHYHLRYFTSHGINLYNVKEQPAAAIIALWNRAGEITLSHKCDQLHLMAWLFNLIKNLNHENINHIEMISDFMFKNLDMIDGQVFKYAAAEHLVNIHYLARSYTPETSKWLKFMQKLWGSDFQTQWENLVAQSKNVDNAAIKIQSFVRQRQAKQVLAERKKIHNQAQSIYETSLNIAIQNIIDQRLKEKMEQETMLANDLSSKEYASTLRDIETAPDKALRQILQSREEIIILSDENKALNKQVDNLSLELNFLLEKTNADNQIKKELKEKIQKLLGEIEYSKSKNQKTLKELANSKQTNRKSSEDLHKTQLALEKERKELSQSYEVITTQDELITSLRLANDELNKAKQEYLRLIELYKIESEKQSLTIEQLQQEKKQLTQNLSNKTSKNSEQSQTILQLQAEIAALRTQALKAESQNRLQEQLLNRQKEEIAQTKQQNAFLEDQIRQYHAQNSILQQQILGQRQYIYQPSKPVMIYHHPVYNSASQQQIQDNYVHRSSQSFDQNSQEQMRAKHDQLMTVIFKKLWAAKDTDANAIARLKARYDSAIEIFSPNIADQSLDRYGYASSYERYVKSKTSTDDSTIERALTDIFSLLSQYCNAAEFDQIIKDHSAIDYNMICQVNTHYHQL